MSSLVENVAKVTAAHAALKDAIAAKGVTVPEGTKLTGMPALVGQIETGGAVEPTNPRAVFAYDSAASIVVPKVMVVDMTECSYLFNCFRSCTDLTSLTLPDGFGQNATNLSSCFYDCRALTSLTFPDGFGQNATDLSFCFYNCRALTSLTFPDGFGQNAKSLTYFFSNCRALTSLTLPDGFGRTATNLTYCFDNCTALTTITGKPNFKVSLDLSASTNLTNDSLMTIINGLQTVTGQTLNIGPTNYNKLTPDDKKVATDKGWNLA